jgi:two-component system, sensor histidine kinase and response regulator
MGSTEGNLCSPLADLATARMNTGDDPVFFRKYVALVVESLEELPASLRDAVAAGELRDAERHAHTLRGLAVQICCDTLAAEAGFLETALREGREDEARRALPDVCVLSASLRRFLVASEGITPDTPSADPEAGT